MPPRIGWTFLCSTAVKTLKTEADPPQDGRTVRSRHRNRYGLPCFFDGTVLTVADRTGRDVKTVIKIVPWSRPVLSTSAPAVDSYRPVPSRRETLAGSTLPSRPVEKMCPNRSTPPSKSLPTIPSRRQNPPVPSRYYRGCSPSRCRI